MNMAQPNANAMLRGTLRSDEPMRRHVSWRAGGVAARAYLPADPEDLARFLSTLPAGEPVLFVGLGSNLLVRDGGFRGTVVLLHASHGELRRDGDQIEVGAGVACPKVARFAAKQGLAGAEFLAGIPGTMGGALAMNAGCYGGETWSLVARARCVSRAGALTDRPAAEFRVAYRHVALQADARLGEDAWFAGARLKLAPGDGERSRAVIRELLARRIATQPLGLPNAGSVFRNPPGAHAAQLIEACGLKGRALGGARISEMHANFIVNPEGRARAADIEALIELARETVRAQHGVDLVTEVRIVGEPA